METGVPFAPPPIAAVPDRPLPLRQTCLRGAARVEPGFQDRCAAGPARRDDA